MMYLQTGNCSGNGSWTRFGPGSFSIMDQTYVQQLAQHIAGLAAFTWTDAVLTPGNTVVSAIPLAELRAALNAAYQAASRPAPSYTDPLIVARSLLVRAVHIQELGAAVRALQ